jgi:hypothetical protein
VGGRRHRRSRHHADKDERSLLTLADSQHFHFFPQWRSRAFRYPIYHSASGGHVFAPTSALAIGTLSVCFGSQMGWLFGCRPSRLHRVWFRNCSSDAKERSGSRADNTIPRDIFVDYSRGAISKFLTRCRQLVAGITRGLIRVFFCSDFLQNPSVPSSCCSVGPSPSSSS